LYIIENYPHLVRKFRRHKTEKEDWIRWHFVIWQEPFNTSGGHHQSRGRRDKALRV